MDSEVIFRRSGYEYRYRIGMDDEMISSYRDQIRMRSSACSSRRFILEVRTNFILKKQKNSEEEIIESERFAKIYSVNLGHILIHRLKPDEIEVYVNCIRYRLREYWLPDNEIERIAHEAMCFVKRMAADPQTASLHVIPVVVYMDVCTVQLQGELLDATILRLIKPDCLIPFHVWGISIVLADGARLGGSPMSKEPKAMSLRHRMYLLNLPRERVEDVAIASARMELCPICFKPPTYGTQITPLPCDHILHKHCTVPRDHVFHNHCIVRWLMNNKTCPVCYSEITIEIS